MDKKFLEFGERVEGYDIPVINEREARGAAGILLVMALFSFFYAYAFRDFRYTQIFVYLFLIDFFIRVVIHPRFSPSLILARFFVSSLKPEYVGAAQKRFAWSIGLVLAIVMSYIIHQELMLPMVKIPICLLCIALLFFESAFGICLGCRLYHLLLGKKAQYCAGESCEIRHKEPIQFISKVQYLIMIVAFSLFAWFIYGAYHDSQVMDKGVSMSQEMKCGAGKCGAGKCGAGKCGSGR